MVDYSKDQQLTTRTFYETKQAVYALAMFVYAGPVSLHNQCVGIHNLINFCPRNQKQLQETQVLYKWAI